jgi:hypothetical protein
MLLTNPLASRRNLLSHFTSFAAAAAISGAFDYDTLLNRLSIFAFFFSSAFAFA